MRGFAGLAVSLTFIATSLVSTSLYAAGTDAPQSSGLLAPGKPAGVTQAQTTEQTLYWTAAALGIAGIVLLATEGSSNNLASTTTTQVSTTTTTS